MAEAIHTASDCLNQILLLVGLRQAARAPTEKHPLGTGRASYFWSFLVALLLFFGVAAPSRSVKGIEKTHASPSPFNASASPSRSSGFRWSSRPPR